MDSYYEKEGEEEELYYTHTRPYIKWLQYEKRKRRASFLSASLSQLGRAHFAANVRLRKENASTLALHCRVHER